MFKDFNNNKQAMQFNINYFYKNPQEIKILQIYFHKSL